MFWAPCSRRVNYELCGPKGFRQKSRCCIGPVKVQNLNPAEIMWWGLWSNKHLQTSTNWSNTGKKHGPKLETDKVTQKTITENYCCWFYNLLNNKADLCFFPHIVPAFCFRFCLIHPDTVWFVMYCCWSEIGFTSFYELVRTRWL